MERNKHSTADRSLSIQPHETTNSSSLEKSFASTSKHYDVRGWFVSLISGRRGGIDVYGWLYQGASGFSITIRII